MSGDQVQFYWDPILEEKVSVYAIPTEQEKERNIEAAIKANAEAEMTAFIQKN